MTEGHFGANGFFPFNRAEVTLRLHAHYLQRDNGKLAEALNKLIG
jgi:hypothetical protein